MHPQLNRKSKMFSSHQRCDILTNYEMFHKAFFTSLFLCLDLNILQGIQCKVVLMFYWAEVSVGRITHECQTHTPVIQFLLGELALIKHWYCSSLFCWGRGEKDFRSFKRIVNVCVAAAAIPAPTESTV